MTTGNSGYQFGRRGGIYMSGGSVTSTYNMWGPSGLAQHRHSTIELDRRHMDADQRRYVHVPQQEHLRRAWLNIYGGTFNNNGNWRRGDSTTAYTDVQWGITLKEPAGLHAVEQGHDRRLLTATTRTSRSVIPSRAWS